MENRESPKTTGISDITGKVVRVRHASEADAAFIEETMKKYRLGTENLDYDNFVVATENREIVGFGNLKKTGGIYEVGCIVVVEAKRGRGIGHLIVKHLMDYAPVDRVYVMTDQTDYFRKLGFVEMKDRPKEYLEALNKVCEAGGKEKVLMSYEKTGR
jgi:N-acetylglutamate synthase-like GNAT family acetyltransferase